MRLGIENPGPAQDQQEPMVIDDLEDPIHLFACVIPFKLKIIFCPYNILIFFAGLFLVI